MNQTIALVDDDRNILTSISMALENEGFKVQTYIDAENALVGISRNPPDLAVIDIKMPRMNGNELLMKVRSSNDLELKNMPIIFLTSISTFFAVSSDICSCRVICFPRKISSSLAP